jgi:hypothetical protein
MPFGSEGIVLGVPVRVFMDVGAVGRWFSDAAVGGVDSDLSGSDACGASLSGSLES